MEKGIFEDSVNVVERAIDHFKSELSSIFAVGKQMPATERLMRAEQFLSLASVVLRIEEKIVALREITEEVEGKKLSFLHAIKEKKPSLSPSTRNKWRG